MNRPYTKSEIKQFWVGLMDGEGSVQVNHWKKKNLQYRLTIKLKFTEANINMLQLIKENIGGRAWVSQGKWAIWAVDDRNYVQEIMKIYDEYPPITTRVELQLKFLKNCLAGTTVDMYLCQRDLKYADQATMARERNERKFEEPNYFNIWLAGFTEAEACFSTTASTGLRYNISQKTDKYILQAIKEKFKFTSNVRESSPDFFVVETGAKEPLGRVLTHFEAWPLLGEKSVSFSKFSMMYKAKHKLS